MDWATGLAIVAQNSDTSDFSDDEVRPLPAIIGHLDELKSWDGKIPKLEPRRMDVGVNKSKNLFVFVGDKWKSVSQY